MTCCRSQLFQESHLRHCLQQHQQQLQQQEDALPAWRLPRLFRETRLRHCQQHQ
jgi:hypothetical protein